MQFFKSWILLIFIFLSTNFVLFAQNETSKWYFGYNVGVDFLTTSPTILNNGAMGNAEGCSSISDASGNLLFYTNGVTIWNQTHSVMANGSGLLGDVSAAQGALIVKQPNSTSKYFVFTLDAFMGPDGLRYSIVDMSLAAGMGSVTIKNVLLKTPSSEKLAAVKHCNGNDVWVVSHDTNNVFRCFLVTNAGVSASPVISSFPYNGLKHSAGSIKLSMNGNKIGLTSVGTPGSVELYDFDNSTGLVSNGVTLINSNYCYSCEFSPDCSKFYATNTNNWLFQWDLCSGSSQSIAATQFTVTNLSFSKATLQLAMNGKIYVAKPNQAYLGIIQQPNLVGSACSYTDQGLAITSGTVDHGLPNFVSSYLLMKQPFAFETVQNCITSFSPQVCVGTSSLNSVKWNFGDPQSGSLNTSTVLLATHQFSASGTYTVKVVRNYNCYSDSITQIINVAYVTPTLNISGKTNICKGEKTILTVSGANTYSWSNSVLSSSIAITPTLSGNYNYSVTGTSTLGNCSTTKVVNLIVSNCIGFNEEATSSFKLFPNPSNGILFIETDKLLEIEIYNEVGEIVLSEKADLERKEIDIQKFSPGLYYLKVQEKPGKERYFKLIKTN